MPDELFGLPAADVALLAVLAASGLVGLWRGFVFEVMSLLGWVAAYFGAQRLSPWVVDHLPLIDGDPAIRWGASFALAFLAVLIAWSLLARLVRLLVQATPLRWPDRLVGGVFGLLRGVVLLLAAATLLNLSPLRDHPQWQVSHGRVWLERLLEGIKPFLPSDLLRQLQRA